MKNIILFLFFVFFSQLVKGFFEPNLKIHYYQEIENLITKKKKKLEGVIDYQYPGKFKLNQADPDSLIFVSNAKTSWYYTPPFEKGVPGELIINPQGMNRYSYGKLFDVLKSGLKSNKFYDVKKINLLQYRIIYKKEMRDHLGVESSILSFKSKVKVKNLVSLELNLLEGPKKKYYFSKVDSSVVFSKDYFNFEVPKNTNITK